MPFVIAALLSSLFYAVADNANGLTTKQNGPFRVAWWASVFGALIFLVPLVLFFQHELARLTPENIMLMLGINVLVSLGYLSFLMGMSKGSITLTGVIGGSFPAVTTIVSMLLFGERVSTVQGLAIVAILLGIALSSMSGNLRTLIHDIRSSAVLFALGAFFLWGVYFALIRIPVEQVGWFFPQYVSNLTSIVLYLLIAYCVGKKDVMRKPKLAALIAVIAVLQISGSMLYNYAISKGSTSIVAPLAGSSPAIFVVLAFFVFKEKINNYQKLGIAAALTGIIALAALS